MGRKSGFLLAAVLTGAAYWLRQQVRGRARSVPHDITRWEDEGGAFHGDRALALQDAPGTAAEPAHPSSAGGSTRDAWEFPRG